IRESVPMHLRAGDNRISFTNASAHIEPDSVMLRDIQGRREFQVLEQNYRNDPVSQERLLALFEGKTIDFLVPTIEDPNHTETGKIIRSGYIPHYAALGRYNQQYYQAQVAYAGQTAQP